MHSGKTILQICFTIGLTMMMAATIGCNGGDGGGSGGGSDTTAPQVSSVAPADGATDITLDADISANFNEAMNATTVNGTSMTISPAVAGSVAYDAAAQRATFSPTVSLTASTTYTVTITTGCTDAAGNPLAADYSWSFTTGTTAVNAWTQVGGQVSPVTYEGEDPTMMIVSNAPAVGYRYESSRIYLNRWNGSDWGATAPDPSGNNCTSGSYHAPSFCSNGSTIYLAYSHAGDPTASDGTFYNRIMAYEWTVNGGYSILNGGNEVSIPWDGSVGANAWEAAVGCYEAELPWVAWVEANASVSGSDDHAWAADVTASGSTLADHIDRNSNTGSYATDVRTVGVMQHASGCAYVAQWESHHNDQDQTDLYVSYTCGSSYTTLGGAVTEDWDYNNLSKPSMAWYDGKLHIAYTQDDKTTKHVHVRSYSSGTWTTVGGGPVTAFSATDHYDSANPDLLVADGTLYAAWQEEDNYDGPFIYVAYYDPGTSAWVIDGDQLNTDTLNEAFDPSLAYNADDGYLYVAFEENTDGHSHIFVKRKRHIP
ncbi:MAG: Ig-like domain-containing protein [Desulfobacteraceae bacterium]|jgi:hypothetical protein